MTLGRLLVHLRSLLVPKSSSKGGFGGPKKILFLKEVIFHETSVGVDPAAHQGIEKASLFGTKIEPKSSMASTFTLDVLFPTSGMTFVVSWVVLGPSSVICGTPWVALGGLQHSKRPPKDPKTAPRAPKKHPKSAQVHSRSTPKHLRSTPRSP